VSSGIFNCFVDSKYSLPLYFLIGDSFGLGLFEDQMIRYLSN